jgi:flagellar protein FliS
MTAKNSALDQYNKVGVHGGVDSASPHRLIQMLMEGVLEKIAIAKGHMLQGNIAEKGAHISWAISIVDGLKVSLDKSSGGEIANNLDALYEYMQQQLLQANIDNNPDTLDEISKLMLTIKEGWDSIPDEYRVPGAVKKPSR